MNQCHLTSELGGLKSDPALQANWLTVRDWRSERRFPPHKIPRQEVHDLMSAAFDPKKGVYRWLESIFQNS